MFYYGKDLLTVGKAIQILHGSLATTLTPEVRTKILQSQQYVENIVAKSEKVYGINTGFGVLCDTIISDTQTKTLQYNLLRSHSVGVGKPIAKDLAKLMLICKVQSLAKGFSGVNLATVERILWHIENDVIPVVPEKGSVGASGDLAPLSHLFLPLLGLGEVFDENKIVPTADILKKYNLAPIQLGAKEGLALINGTQFILAHAVMGVARLHHCLELADIIGAISLEALMGSIKPFEARLHRIRPFRGNLLVAQRIYNLVKESEVLKSHVDCERVQDPYSLRCMPQVHGASRNAWLHLKELTEIELNAVTDNPIIFGENDTISGGNFHGQPLALPLDYATLAAAEIGNISDRRCYLMIEGRFGLPRLLLKETGLNSGFMIPQYTTAALVSENKSLCFPASADSIPTSLGQEDHVSMGSISGRKLHQVIDNLEYILAIEMLYATQALEFRRPLRSTALVEDVVNQIRQQVAFATEDRIFAEDINTIHQLILSKSFKSLVQEYEKLNIGFEEFKLD
ncbi:histidine ammonia-lyase [Thermoflexibacter ruber]|uniref:Histidine ammonia-lyase n=1 Tax=Thermoflexibacter ruber TaxID=1003 RepID=A0A1I2EHH9_9BACT|nr:histidine ammonia-lyase [Thermoflexibacter ruber]SFE92315.1 histidine ammonia-lyase [Thermoflexibacter ruber]